jgi:hypothetical protein
MTTERNAPMKRARHLRLVPRGGDIGKEEREVTFEPIPDTVPVREPAPERPVEAPEPVPA